MEECPRGETTADPNAVDNPVCVCACVCVYVRVCVCVCVYVCVFHFSWVIGRMSNSFFFPRYLKAAQTFESRPPDIINGAFVSHFELAISSFFFIFKFIFIFVPIHTYMYIYIQSMYSY